MAKKAKNSKKSSDVSGKKKLRDTSNSEQEDLKEKNLKILKQRAKELASVKEKVEASKLIHENNILEFRLGQEVFGIESNDLKEILISKQITEVPCTPSYIFGVINIRGQIVTVIDLKKFLQLDYVGFNNDAPIVIAKYQDGLVGFVADSVIGIKKIDNSHIQKHIPKFKNFPDTYVMGISNDTTIILDIVNILSSESIIVNEIV